VNGYIEEMISGQRDIKVFTHEKEVMENFEPINEKLYAASTRATIATSVVGPLLNNLSHMFYALTCAIGVLWLTGEEVGGILIAFLQYIRTFADRVSQISEQFNSIMLALAGAERIFEVLDLEPEVDEGKVTLEKVENDYNWVLPDGKRVPLRGDVRFNNVDFAYVEGKPVLHDLSLFAKPGHKIAFVGSTGAGKTTITNLINRFYDIQGGEIIYDGINVKDIKKDDLRRSLGIVLQDTHLFTGTVMENIRYGNLEATDEDCIEAAKIANAHYFISHLPQGYNTMLHSDGANLSQGQRQLLAIARAAVSKAPVLILDEATSSVDTRTEKLIEKGLDGLMKGRTVFIIAHRLSTVRNSNAILVLEHGKVVERGDHDDLLAQKGKYYQLYTNMTELS
ncbi:MAG: ABC transporter ATP-binding protein, partial [Oscillospiraceae bacterium]|nr:ABC transporter ATP-binding protein [Oscillospiraceae bacterium]